MIRATTGTTTAALAFSCLLSGGCKQPAAAQKPEQVRLPALEEGEVRVPKPSLAFIEVQQVSGATSDSTFLAPARVDFRDGAVSQVGAPLDGRVAAVHVLVGQQVAAGAPLVTLDCPDAAAMRSAADVARASLREARMDLDRERRMQQEGVGTERELVSAETKASAAEADVARVESSAASIGAGTGDAVIVRAPIAGVVISRKASVGLTVQRGVDPLVEIGDATRVWVVADVFERDLAHVRPGARGRLTFPSVAHPLDGRVASIGAVVASGLRTAPVFLRFESHEASLRPGMYGRVEIDTADSGITLPANAVLIKDGKDPVVYVQKDELTFVRRRVVVAQPVEGRVQVVSGLSPGEKVVIRGTLLLDNAADQLL